MADAKKIVVNGLVIRSSEYKENDVIVTALTEELGKISFNAKGIKSLRSRNRGACQFLTFSEFVLNEHGGFYTLSEGTVRNMFDGLASELEKSALAYYIAETVDYVCLEGVPEPEILRLALNTVYALSTGMKSPDTVKAVYELRLALCLGLLPDFTSCTECGRDADGLYLSEKGSVLCGDCVSKLQGENYSEITDEELSFLRYEAEADPKKIFRVGDISDQRLKTFAQKHLSDNVQHGFSTLKYYNSLKTLN